MKGAAFAAWAAMILVAAAEDPFVRELDLRTIELKPGCHGRFERTGGAVDMVFPPYDGRSDATKWPGTAFALPKDCSGYDRLEYGMFAVKGDRFSINVRANGGHNLFEHKRADVDQVQLPVYVFDLRQFSDQDRANMSHFTIYQSGPGEETRFRMRSVRLVSTLPERASALASAMADIGLDARAVAALPDRVRQGEVPLREADARLVEATARFTSERLGWIRRQSSAAHPDARFAVAALDDLEKLRPQGNALFEPLRTGGWDLELARREREGMQLFVFAPDETPLANVRIGVSRFTDAAGHALEPPVAAPVGRVTVRSTKGPPSAAGEHFDPVCEFTNAVESVAAGRVQAFHVRFRAEADTPAGLYRGKVVITADGAGRAEVPVTVRVRDVTLPVASTLKTATSVYGSKLMGDNVERFKDWILDEYRLNPLSIYADRPGDASTYADKVRRGMTYVPILYLPNPDDSHFNRVGRKKGFASRAAYWDSLSDEERAHYPAEETEYLVRSLRKAISELKAAGVWPMASCYAFDEFRPYHTDAIGELSQTLKKAFPDLRIASTAYPSDDPRVLGMVDQWIPTVADYDVKTADRFRKRYGNEVWYYTIYMTVDVDTLASIRAEVGAKAFTQRVDGWLVWTVSRWFDNPKPIVSAGETGWNPESFPGLNGGGSYFCMGPGGRFLPTLRAEALRDGLEDHCLLTMAKSCPSAARLMARLTPERKSFSAGEQRRLRHLVLNLLEGESKHDD